ncbi:MAG: T9SS type A sorting domain-containing protein [Flavobacteriales bacterium]|mgnify:FL=1|jgi:hypothetical protein|nr:T9SS type A sorting domain-containing protein [Flavobacteriales bacterium]NCG29451.1 T9SS type A sorting domain-containing protein [Bacteroidota bacterium]MBT3963994.1 T9SS type A sorting domain-containing protein [Flavobacteriales bacterium]MBT4703899.1 T9SS type A sorting domain-containing protein [Flavobacteriales bacterium]MBT4931046.1 T9SS type A sorting domain-containing protein [Flavobacteriales bacterium]
MKRIATLLGIILISVSSFAQLSVSPGDTSICTGESVTYTASGMLIMGWLDTLNQDTTTNPSYQFSTDSVGTFAILAIGLDVLPADTDTVVVIITVNQMPDVAIVSSAGSEFCSGSSSELIVTPAAADSYMWSPAGSLSSDSTDTVMASPTTTTEYFVTVTDNGCSATASITLTVNPSPSVTITSDDDNGNVCAGNSVTMTAVANGIATYEWSPGTSLNDSTSMTVIGTPSASTIYTVVVTDTNGCTASMSKTINVNSNPPFLSIGVTPEDSIICSGESATLDASSNALSYVWSPGGSLNTTTGSTVIASPTSTTTYSVTATLNGCTNTDQIEITVLSGPTMTYFQSSGGSAICLDQTDSIVITCSTCSSYTWELPSSTVTTPNNTQIISPNVPGAIDIDVTGYDTIGCFSEDVITLNVNDCYLGDPFGIEETKGFEVKIATLEESLRLIGSQAMTTVELYNLLGERIFERKAINTSTFDIPVYDLSSGIYLVKVEAGKNSITQKVYLD